MPGSSTPATALLTRSSVAFTVHSYRAEKSDESYGDEAVRHMTEKLGIDPWQVFKTLVVAVPHGREAALQHGLAVAVVPVPARLSTKSLAAALGVPKATMADRADVERSTGYVFGGVSPVGQRRPLPTVVDDSALRWFRVLCSGGRRGLEIELDPRDLVRVTRATVAAVTA